MFLDDVRAVYILFFFLHFIYIFNNSNIFVKLQCRERGGEKKNARVKKLYYNSVHIRIVYYKYYSGHVSVLPASV